MIIGTAAVIAAFICGVVFSDQVKAGLAKLKGDVESDLQAEIEKIKEKV